MNASSGVFEENEKLIFGLMSLQKKGGRLVSCAEGGRLASFWGQILLL
jgi:hypothetical protein